MKRYEALIDARRKARQETLDAVASSVREAALRHGFDIEFFGSFADGRVGPNSDLDVLVKSPEVSDDFLSDIEKISMMNGIEIDVRFSRDAPHLLREAIF